MIKKSLVSACLAASLVSQPLLADDAINAEALFQEAMQSREAGDLFHAIELFETILQHQPELNRARLELAVSYHQTRRYEAAKEHLTQVMQDPATPENVKLAISAYLAQLSGDIKANEKRSTHSLYLSAGLFNDTNINLGPNNVRNFPSLNPSAVRKSSEGSQLMLSYSHRNRAAETVQMGNSAVDFEWLTQAIAYNKAYNDGNSDFNLSVLSFNTGPALLANQKWRAALNIKFDKVYFGNDPYSTNLSLNPVFTYNLSDDMELTVENTLTDKEHDNAADQGLDGTVSSWNINLSKFYPQQVIGVQAGIKYHDNGADDQALHYSGAEIYLGGQIPAWTNARAYMTLSSRNYNYSGVDGFVSTTTKRDETELQAMLGVSHDFRSGWFKSWTLNAQYTHTDNDANLQAFEYQRNIFELNMRRYFL